MNPAHDAQSHHISQITQVSVNQGEVHFTAEPKILVTILGSCVAVCLWDRIRGFGGMNHFVLPSDPQGERSPRYGDVAVDKLVAGLVKLGCSTANLQAKVFGGAAVLPFIGGKSIGLRNVELALDRLSDHHIQVAGRRTGGSLGQQIRFHTRTGEVLFRHLAGGTNDRVAIPAPSTSGPRSWTVRTVR